MFKRFLFVLTDESEIDEIIKFSKSLETTFGSNVERDIVYVKDVMKYDIFPLTIQGLGISSNTSLLMEEHLKIENENYNKYEKRLQGYFRKVYSVTGELIESVLEELKAYDLLVICKSEGEKISTNLSSLLKNHYKPLIILSNTEKDYKFDKVLILNDGGYSVNSSVYQYFNIFGIRDIDVLRVNVEDKNRLTERFGTSCNFIDKTGDEVSIILETVPNYDLVIMGDLRYSLLFERITGQVGIKVLENTKVPIFMG
ncbi:GntR family transcriptional regulator [Pseudostreptobacillus hongkongensis]|uniref:GntR family transcriptional regulator n=1 Tax=Pseudostreptobacillus hongkongensis TaxID=1162717 RepID=UPI0028D8F3FD|nr:GntR family transcriptional regulator [Pseudostreptobacillus hongkongensis]